MSNTAVAAEKVVNPVRPTGHKILEIIKETKTEWTFRLENSLPIQDGQFMQLSIPRVGEAPISVSGYGPGYCDFTIRNVGKVTKELFSMKKGDTIFMRGAYGHGWPLERFAGKNMLIVAGGTGVAPIKTLSTCSSFSSGALISEVTWCSFCKISRKLIAFTFTKASSF